MTPSSALIAPFEALGASLSMYDCIMGMTAAIDISRAPALELTTGPVGFKIEDVPVGVNRASDACEAKDAIFGGLVVELENLEFTENLVALDESSPVHMIELLLSDESIWEIGLPFDAWLGPSQFVILDPEPGRLDSPLDELLGPGTIAILPVIWLGMMRGFPLLRLSIALEAQPAVLLYIAAEAGTSERPFTAVAAVLKGLEVGASFGPYSQ